MDPDETLKALREQAAELALDSDYADPNDVQEMVEKFRALDAWLSNGGFRPAAWVT